MNTKSYTMKIGIIRERKYPPDTRVPLNPMQCKEIVANKNVELVIESSPDRCFSDEQYAAAGISVVQDVSDCDILLGVKEVPKERLIADKHYFFFSHTIKEQEYNRSLLQTILSKNIKLTDYETITNERNQRLIAFGKFAGMVGAHNAIYTYNERNPKFELKRMHQYDDYYEAKQAYKNIKIDPVKIVLTGTGRVSHGAAMVLEDMGIKQVAPLDFVFEKFEGPVFTQLNCFFYVKRKDGKAYDRLEDFYDNPEDFESDFHHFLPVADVMINGIYWDPAAPAFFTKEQMKSPDFNISVISDVTCDIAPEASIPSTLHATTIADPIFGYDPINEAIVPPHADGVIDMTTIDNLPNELPKDASTAFGEMFIEHVLDELLKSESALIERSSICSYGKLHDRFAYLQNYVDSE